MLNSDAARSAGRISEEAAMSDPVLIDGMPCPYCSPGCETRGLPEPTIKDNHVVCFCPCHRLAEVLVTIKTLETECGRLELERDEANAWKEAAGAKAHRLQEQLDAAVSAWRAVNAVHGSRNDQPLTNEEIDHIEALYKNSYTQFNAMARRLIVTIVGMRADSRARLRMLRILELNLVCSRAATTMAAASGPQFHAAMDDEQKAEAELETMNLTAEEKEL